MREDELLDALSAGEVLREDHQRFRDLFEGFAAARDDEERKESVDVCLRELRLHHELEEELFYPFLREEGSPLAAAKALVEHRLLDQLVREIRSLGAGTPEYAARFMVLSDLMRGHMEEEEAELIPRVENSGIDFAGLGRRMLERRRELEGSAGRPTRAKPSAGRPKPARRH